MPFAGPGKAGEDKAAAPDTPPPLARLLVPGADGFHWRVKSTFDSLRCGRFRVGIHHSVRDQIRAEVVLASG
jgi:hypothetical protein